MEEENKEVPASVEQEEENNEEGGEEETIEAIKESRDKALKKASDQELRAKIAEDKLKSKAPEKKPEASKKSDDLSQTDIFVLTKAGVELEDLDSIKMLSKTYGLSIAETLNNDEVKAILKVRKEKRDTAQATYTGKTPSATKTMSDDVILSKFKKGEVPEPGSKEADALFWARRGGKK